MFACSSNSLKPFALAGLLCAAALTVIAPSTAEARRPAPPVQPASTAQFSCEIPVTAPRSVRAAFEEHYTCTEPLLDEWLGMYPAEAAQLQQLYQAWQSSRSHDLRDQPEAARWVRRHPVNFTDRHVELSAAQVEELAPMQGGEPVAVSGTFERMFVDRDNRRLFLTTEEEGLVSIGIASRYAFKLEGKVGQAGARDFFIFDASTALVEERSFEGGNRDLVVLDISNRSRPREIARLRGAIPEVGGRASFDRSMLENPPTFDQYRLIREGQMMTSCGAQPTVSSHPGIQCRPDGSCYRIERRHNANEGICERLTSPAVVAVQPDFERRRRMDWAEMDMAPTGAGGGGVSIGMAEGRMAKGASEASPAPSRMSRPSAAPMQQPSAAFDEAMPDGGQGGAGSLSQMMVFGQSLYVLSGGHGQSQGWLTTFDLSRPHQPRVRQVVRLDNGPEALQRHDNLLLVAGRDAVVTASLGDASRPRLLGEFRQHCPVNYDPIVVQGSIGYRTIIVEGRRINCTSRLEVIDLSQPHQPVLRNTHALSRPRGLAVLGERLFVADEQEGVAVFDLTDPVVPVRVGTWSMVGVKDLVLSDFDLYAMTGDEIQTFYVGPLYQRGVRAHEVVRKVEGYRTVVRKTPKHRAERPSRRGGWQHMF
jgi:hypothetical protein